MRFAHNSEIVDDLWRDELTFRQIALKHGVSRYGVSLIARRWGYPNLTEKRNAHFIKLAVAGKTLSEIAEIRGVCYNAARLYAARHNILVLPAKMGRPPRKRR